MCIAHLRNRQGRILSVVRTCSQGSAVVEALERAGGVDNVAAGEHIDLSGNVLAVITTGVIGI